jgi:UDP:flavonoid glycosyltransferase YjiC (YdhE family)
MTKLVIVTVGSRGDAQPYVALGVGLQKVGFQVCIATHGRYADFIEQHGLQFAPLPEDPKEMLNKPEGREWINAGQNPFRFLRAFTRVTRKQLPEMLPAVERACQGADGVLFALFGVPAYHVAEKMGIPAVLAALQPVSRSATFLPMGALELPFSSRWSNLFAHFAVEQVFWQPFRRQYNDWRTKKLGLPTASFWGPYTEIWRRKIPVIYGYSGHVLPAPPDWGEHIRVTGYWFLDQAADWQPDAGLLDFLAAGPPPISIGFGSMTTEDPRAFTEMVVAAVRQAGQRAVFLTGWGGLQGVDLPDFIYPLEAAPHDWLFPRMAAVVHHGGAGTTAAGLRAGKPTVIAPFFADQHFWGRRVKALGVGPDWIDREKLTADNLAQAITTAVTDPTMQAKAAQLGEKIRAEDGVGQAVAAVQQIFRRG